MRCGRGNPAQLSEPCSEEMLLSIDLVLADPFPVMLDGMSHALAGEADFLIRAQVTDGESALAAVQRWRPDILVFDLPLPGRDGLSLLAALRAEGQGTRPVLFTSAAAGDIVEAIRRGVQGVVRKDMSMHLLVRCIREVQAGRRWLEKGVANSALNYLLHREAGQALLQAQLTPRELAVARMVAEGLPNKRIASRLAISEGTAKLHLHRVYQKLQLRSRLELLRYMQKTGGAG